MAPNMRPGFDDRNMPLEMLIAQEWGWPVTARHDSFVVDIFELRRILNREVSGLPARTWRFGNLCIDLFAAFIIVFAVALVCEIVIRRRQRGRA